MSFGATDRDMPPDEETKLRPRCVYKGYLLATMTTAEGDGVGPYRARVAVVVLDGQRTRSQHFVDFELFDDEGDANGRALSGGKEWVDLQLRQSRHAFATDFAPLN